MEADCEKTEKKETYCGCNCCTCIIADIGYIKFFNGTFIYISTGFGKDGLLKTGNKKASVMEADILLADAKSEYEDLFGTDIWNQSVGDVKFDEYVKEQVKAKLERVYCMNTLKKPEDSCI